MGERNLNRSGGALAEIDELNTRLSHAETAGDKEYVNFYSGEIQKVYDRMDTQGFEWDEKDFSRNKPVLDSFKSFYETRKGKAWEGSEDDLAKEFKSTMGWFDYNLPYMLNIAKEASEWDDNTLQNFSDMMEGYRKLDLGAGSTFKNVGRLAADPSSWIGLSTFGVGFGAKAGAQVAAKQGLKAYITNRLKNRTLKGAAIIGAEAGAYTTAVDAARQEVEDPEAQYDVGRGAKAFGTGAAIGAPLGAVFGRVAQNRRLARGKGDAQDWIDDGIRLNRVTKRARDIRTAKEDLSSLGEGAGILRPGGNTQKSLSFLERVPLVGDFVKGYNKSVIPKTKLKADGGVPTGPEVADAFGRVAGTTSRGNLGDTIPAIGGSGSARMQAQNIKNDLTRRFIGGLARTAFRAGTGKSLRRNLSGPLVQSQARKLAKSGKEIPETLSEGQIREIANFGSKNADNVAPYSSILGAPGRTVSEVVAPTPISKVDAEKIILGGKPTKVVDGAKPKKGSLVDEFKSDDIEAGLDAKYNKSTPELKADVPAPKTSRSVDFGKMSDKEFSDLGDFIGNLSNKDLQAVISGKRTAQLTEKTGKWKLCGGK